MNIASMLILIYLGITFVQSGYDKIMDWRSNVDWLKDHFSKTFLSGMVPQALFVILAVELIAGVLCFAGILELWLYNGRVTGYYGAVFSCIALIFLLFGQRIAKDYEGAKTITIYFIPAVLAVHWLS